MKMGSSDGTGAMLSGCRDCGARAVVLAGAFEPVSESGPGRCYVPQIVASFPESTQSRLFYSVAAPATARAPTQACHGHSLPLLCWLGRPQGEGRRLRPQAPRDAGV